MIRLTALLTFFEAVFSLLGQVHAEPIWKPIPLLEQVLAFQPQGAPLRGITREGNPCELSVSRHPARGWFQPAGAWVYELTYSDGHPGHTASSAPWTYSHNILVRRMEDVEPLHNSHGLSVRGDLGFNVQAGMELSIDSSGRTLEICFSQFKGLLGITVVRARVEAAFGLREAQGIDSASPALYP
jgi:hypothetical protein